MGTVIKLSTEYTLGWSIMVRRRGVPYCKGITILETTIVLGLGGFHMEKNVLGAIGQYLSKIGERGVFVLNELYGPNVTDNKEVGCKMEPD